MKVLYIDFEFNRVTHPNVNLVCAVSMERGQVPQRFWLHNDPKEQKRLVEHLNKYDTIIAYSAVAEARSFMALGVDPKKFQWIDLFLEYRCISNHNDKINWGNQLVDGKVKFTVKPKPKWEIKKMIEDGIEPEESEDGAKGFKPTHSLAEATYKLLGIIRDTDHKNKMRDLIISDPMFFSKDEKEAIIRYCAEDVVTLPDMFEAIEAEYKRLGIGSNNLSLLPSEMRERGKYSVYTAIMEAKGYPINVDKTKNFSNSISSILYEMQYQINSYFPEIVPFRWNKADSKFTWDQKSTRAWIDKLPFKDRWKRTETGQYSLSLEAFSEFFNFSHDYPTDNFGAQMVRFLKLKQNIYGFSISKDSKRKNFWDSVGPDGRVRPYTNPYGAQSSRSQPASTGFMFLKPAWMRALVEPSEGMAMAGIDYASQEYFVSALLSEDKKMIEAYLSGDVYLAFGKSIKLIPPEGTKDTHKALRDLCKSSILGISYNMTKYGLSIKLTNDTGEEVSEDRAQEIIDQFYEAYPMLKYYQESNQFDYSSNGYLKLPCGWYIFGDNENHRSVGNFPVQGFGASVMRKAVDLCFQRGVHVSFTLHDALYIEYPVGKESHIEILRDSMREAFIYYLPEKWKDIGKMIRLDPFAWSPNYKGKEELKLKTMTVPCGELYVDERSIIDYNQFSKYFEDESTNLL